MRRLYLDHAATTPLVPSVLEAMRPFFMEKFGNPSSLHHFGQEARQAVEKARGEVASFIGARPEEIVFTSSGTESDNLAVKGVAAALGNRGRHIITAAIEHHAISETCSQLARQGFKITFLSPDEQGLIDPDQVRRAITAETILITIMHGNNEIGTIEPIAEIGKVARENGILFHTDAVQTLGHIPIDVDELGIDLLSASAHKLYGPKGVGLLYVRRGTRLEPQLAGGDQERRLRASTHNVAGIVGFGAAVACARENLPSDRERLTSLRDRFIAGLEKKIENCRINGHLKLRLPNNVHVSFEYIEGESLVLSLDLEGIACSTGSACSSLSLEPSHVLLAIGCPRILAQGSVRFSLGRETKGEDIDQALEALERIVQRLRAMSPLYRKITSGAPR